MKSNSFCNHASDKQNRKIAKRFRFVNQGDDYRQNWTTESPIGS